VGGRDPRAPWTLGQGEDSEDHLPWNGPDLSVNVR